MKRLLFALAAVVAGVWMVLDSGPDRDRSVLGREVSARAARNADASPVSPRVAQALPSRAPLAEIIADPFLSPALLAPRQAQPQRAAAPAVPPLPFRFVGRVTQQGS